MGHNINYSEINLSITTAINCTYNTIGRENSTTWRPALSLGKLFFDKSANTRLSAGYNTSSSTNLVTSVTNFRSSVSYILKERHNFNLNAVQLFRSGGSKGNLSGFTATFGYSYAFGLKKPAIRFNKDKVKSDSIRIRYKNYNFIGLPKDITPQLLEFLEKEGFVHLVAGKQSKLEELAVQLKETQELDKNVYKDNRCGLS